MVVTRQWLNENCEVHTAVWVPDLNLFTQPVPLRNTPSTGLIKNQFGQLWIVSLQNHVWTEPLVIATNSYLSSNYPVLDFEYLEAGLSGALEIPVKVHRCDRMEEVISVVQITRLADAVFRRNLSVQKTTPELPILRQQRENLEIEIRVETERAIGLILTSLDQGTLDVLAYAELSFSAYNFFFTDPTRKQRAQFAFDFPLLANFICQPGTNLLWRRLAVCVDSMKSSVRFLSQELSVSLSAVKSIRKIVPSMVGPYFCKHPIELLKLMDDLPPEYRPKNPNDWIYFVKEYLKIKFFLITSQ